MEPLLQGLHTFELPPVDVLISVGMTFSRQQRISHTVLDIFPSLLTAFRRRLTVAKSKTSCQCKWQRVARKRWQDRVMSYMGWYPWQCKRCRTRIYFRLRF